MRPVRHLFGGSPLLKLTRVAVISTLMAAAAVTLISTATASSKAGSSVAPPHSQGGYLPATGCDLSGGRERGRADCDLAGGQPAAGTIAVTERNTVMSYRDGNDVVRELLVRRTLTGTFAGTEVSLVHNVTHPDGSSDLTVTSSCTCTVEGRTGTVTFSERATVDLAGIITVRRKIIDATGNLEGLRGTLEVAAPIAAPAQPYTGRYRFGK